MKASFGIFLGILLLVMASVALAERPSATDGEKVFIIESKEKPAKVLPANKAAGASGVMMRMPNLDSSSVVSWPKDNVEQSKANAHGVKRERTKSRPYIAKKQQITTLKFSKARIQGALRMPRVKFSRVGPSVDIREEIPEMDFNSKTLLDSGF